MMEQGKISDEWIVSYAAGTLSEAHALIVASHISYHSDLQQTLAQAEDIGGMLMDSLDPTDVSEGSFEATLEKLNETMSKPALDEQDNEVSAGSAPKLPAPLASYLGKNLDDLKWRMMGPGMSQVRLWTGPNDERLWLLKARGGTQMPMHDHRGHEFTLVLKGSYHVGDQQYTPGLIEVADGSVTHHEPLIDDGEDCICLVVTEAPIKLHSFLGRLAQPFIGL